jgi:hypothetical protein
MYSEAGRVRHQPDPSGHAGYQRLRGAYAEHRSGGSARLHILPDDPALAGSLSVAIHAVYDERGTP